MKIVLASDHAGFLYKEEIKKFLLNNKIEICDVGTFSNESTDYPIFAKKAAISVAKQEVDLGILVCSSGEGVCITANKVKGVRCGIGYNDDVARLMRNHNNANMIAFGASFMKLEDILRRIEIFINATFEGGRHERRVNEIE